jgi:hypothetical protein
LRRGIRCKTARSLDALNCAGNRRPRRAAFRRQCHQGRRIAQDRAVVGAAIFQHRLWRKRAQRLAIDALGARTVTKHAERRGDLRLGNRACEIVELGIREIAQVADRRRAVPRQHIERIGEITAAGLARLFRIANEIAQPLDCKLERRVGHGKAALLGARQEVGDVRIQPDIAAARRPQAERAVRSLPRQQAIDRVADALVDGGVERQMRLAGEIVDVEQRQRAARDLFRTAERIAVERRQQRRRVKRGRQAH